MTATVFHWTIGDRLRKAREMAGLGTSEMAVAIGVSRNTITNYERDHVRPRPAAIRRWAEVTGVSEDDIRGGEPAGYPPPGYRLAA